MKIVPLHLLSILAACLLAAAAARAQAPGQSPGGPALADETPNVLPPQAQGLDVQEHVGRQVPLDLAFTDSRGQRVRLAEYFQGDRPAIILLVYYKCPIVCDVLMQKAVETLSEVDFSAGREYNLLVFSFDPRETVTDAMEARQVFLKAYGRETVADRGFEFHAGADGATRDLAESLGFKYRKLGDGNFSHPVAKFVMTPDGKVSRYLYGYTQEPQDVKLALMEASQGKLVRTIGERIMNYCYMFNTAQGKYTLRAMRVMQIGALLTLAALTTLIGAFIVGERIRRRGGRRPGPPGAPPPDKVVVAG